MVSMICLVMALFDSRTAFLRISRKSQSRWQRGLRPLRLRYDGAVWLQEGIRLRLEGLSEQMVQDVKVDVAVKSALLHIGKLREKMDVS